MCPQGCKLDRSEAPAEGMYSTAKRLGGNEPAIPIRAAKPAKEAKAKAKPAEEKPPEKGKLVTFPELDAGAGDPIMSAEEHKNRPGKPSKMPEKEASGAPPAPEKQEDKADSLDNADFF